jgi:hypothetical protein
MFMHHYAGALSTTNNASEQRNTQTQKTTLPSVTNCARDVARLPQPLLLFTGGGCFLPMLLKPQ